MPVLVSALLAPIFLIGGWTLAAHRQPAGYDATRDTIKRARRPRRHRPVGDDGRPGRAGRVPHGHGAWGLRRAATAGRVLLAAGGVATLAVAAFPVPRTGSSAAHAVAALVAFGALTLWPLFAAFRTRAAPAAQTPGPRGRASLAQPRTAVLAALLAWFGLELFTDGAHVGLSERVLAGAQALWPLCVVVLSIRRHAARNVRRYADGETPSAAPRCCRSETAVPKPPSRAMRSIGRSLDSSSSRAALTRCWISHCAGLAPTSARNRRVKVRRLILRVRGHVVQAQRPVQPSQRPGPGRRGARRGRPGIGRSMYWA